MGSGAVALDVMALSFLFEQLAFGPIWIVMHSHFCGNIVVCDDCCKHFHLTEKKGPILCIGAWREVETEV